ncbi:MAG: serine hydrolase [Pirellulales bacterium]
MKTAAWPKVAGRLAGLGLAGLLLAGAVERVDAALPTARPADVGLAEERLQEGVGRFRAAVERGEIRGAVVLVACRGRVVLHEAIGWRDFAAQKPLERDTVFHVASNTKPIVALAALQLAEQGRLDLDADVGRYLPEFAREAYRGVTVRRLLSHTSGLRIGPIFLEPLSPPGPTLPNGPTLRSEVARFADIPPVEAPGTSYSYNNPGYNIVAAVLEVVSGQPLEQLLAERIYRPLGMTRSAHRDQPGIVEQRAVIETLRQGLWQRTYQPGDPPKYPFVRGSGGLLTTAVDYAVFLQCMLDEGRYGEQVLLRPESVAAATTAQTRSLYSAEELPKQKAFYGYGWQVWPEGHFGHGGSDGTFAWVDPARQVLGIVFTQSPGGRIPTEEFRQCVNAACVQTPEPPLGVVAHRGWAREFPENTLAAFQACLERRWGFECDVRRSQDGQLVCVHDETLDRTTTGRGPVAEQSLEALRQLDAGNWFRPEFRGARVPTLDEVCALIARYDALRPVVALDLKVDDERVAADLVNVVRRHGVLDRVVVIGRAIESVEVRQRLRAADSAIPVARLVSGPELWPAALADLTADWLYLRFVPTRADIERARAAGKRVFVAGPLFATRQPSTWRQAVASGVAAILTDEAAELTRLERAERWRSTDQAPTSTPVRRPNILWIVVEDMSAHYGCYGERTIATPEVDRLAREGVRFERAFVTGPICSISRSAMITGCYQTTLGAHHHRSGRGTVKIHLPEGIEPLPVLMQRAGYYTCNGSWPLPGQGTALKPGKTDYNFEWPPSMYAGADWSGRQPGQPFFAQIQLHGGKHRDGVKWRERAAQWLPSLTAPESVVLPPYYPRVPGILEDWAAYLDAVRFTDRQVGEIRQRLEKEGLLDETLVFFLTDHGISHVRGKQFLYDEGIRVPLIVRGPGVAPQTVRTDLVEHIDLAAMTLAAAGLPLPPRLQGRPLFATDYVPREAVFAARDRADETVDHLRCVRTNRYKYIRNFLPHRPLLQPNAYKDHKPCLLAFRAAGEAGLLDAVQRQLLAPQRPPEELYDLTADPWEIHNLASDPQLQTTLEDLRGRLNRWMEATQDQGREPEPTAQFTSDMEVYLREVQRDPERRAEIERNIRVAR